MNAPIQGTASEIVKKAMIEIDQKIKAPMLLQVHDEILIEAPKNKIEKMMKESKKIMENCVSLKVPLKVSTSYGKSWFKED